jgi:hypothetical protein
MPVSMMCLDEALHHFVDRYQEQFSKPQYQYFVTVLLGLQMCESRRVLSGLLPQLVEALYLAWLRCFLSQ